MAQSSLVTGVLGFIGPHLTRTLGEEGIDVVAIDLKQPRGRYRTAVYQIAVLSDLSDSTLEVASTEFATSAVSTLRPAERIGTLKIVFANSIFVYGPGEEMKTEGSRTISMSDYSQSRLLSEKARRPWLEPDPARKLPMVRHCVVSGPEQGGCSTRLSKPLEKALFICPGRRDIIKACFYFEDLLDAITFAHGRSEDYLLFKAAYPGSYTLEQIV